MSRSAADATSSAPSNPPDDRRRHKTPRRSSSTSPSRHTLPTHPHAVPGASSSSNIVSQDPPTTSSSRVPTPSAPAPASDPESSHRRRKRERSSPSGSSSQGDMADTEMEGGPSKPSTSESAPEGAPPKKKRTRTLTTPHQAAVLHALLAQSRFPTTQMREEVGRSIGLSARKVQNQRQKARRPRGQATTTSAPLTRPPQFGPFTNAPPGGAASDISPTAMTMHSGSSASADGFFARGLGGSISEMPYSTAGPSSRGPPERFAPAHRDAYFPEEYGRAGAPPAQLAGPGIPGSSRRGLLDDPAWRRPSQGFPGPPFASASASAMEPPEMYRTTPRPGRPPGEQGPALTLSLPPVLATRIDTRRGGPGSSPVTPLSASAGAGPYPTLASLSALESSASAHRTRASDEARRTLPPANVDFSAPRGPPLNIPPPFTLQPRPLWDDPAFSPYNRGRRSSPPSSSFGESPTALHSSFGAEPLPSIAAVVPLPVPVPMAAPAGPSPVRSPLSPVHRTVTRFDPIRSTATSTAGGRAPPPDSQHHQHQHQHPARPGPGPGPHDYTDERPPQPPPPAPRNF